MRTITIKESTILYLILNLVLFVVFTIFIVISLTQEENLNKTQEESIKLLEGKLYTIERELRDIKEYNESLDPPPEDYLLYLENSFQSKSIVNK